MVQAFDARRRKVSAQGLIAPADWATKFIEIEGEGVPSRETFAKGVAAQPRDIVLMSLDLDLRGQAPKDVVKSPDAASISVGAGRFGISSTAPMRFFPGRYRIRVLADDGVRVLLDGKPVIDRWELRGAPAVETHEVEFKELQEVSMSVEYFHDKGGDDRSPARLQLWFEAIDPNFRGG
jgi:hypothetical protein